MAGSGALTVSVDDLGPEQLWALVEPLLPAPPHPPYGGRHRAIPDRNCFAAIVYMARTSTSWRLLPTRELGCGSPATVWRRLTEWANAGVFDQLHLEVLDRLGSAGRLDWSRASVDTMSVRAKRGGTMSAQIPSTAVSQGPSSTSSPTARACRKVYADRGYDARGCRAYLRGRGITARIARRRIESSARLGRHRWRVERALSWLSCYRRLQIRWDRGSERWFAFVLLACALTCFNRL